MTFQCHSLRASKPGISPIADYLVLCGNNGQLQAEAYTDYLAALCDLSWRKIFFIPGPREFYSCCYEDAIDFLHEFEKKLPKLVVLINCGYSITEKLRIVGSIFWTQLENTCSLEPYAIFSEEPALLKRCGHIFQSVGTDGIKTMIDAKWWNVQHKTAIEFLKDEILSAEQKKIQILIASHHAPSDLLLPAELIEKPKFSSHVSSNDFTMDCMKTEQNPTVYWFSSTIISPTRTMIQWKKTIPHLFGRTIFYANTSSLVTKLELPQHVT